MIIDDYASSAHVRSDKIGALKALFEKRATGVEQAYIAPQANGWMAIYPRQGDTAPRWAEIASRELKTVAVAFQVIEDRVFTYHLYENGELKDTYVSRPSYFHGDQRLPEEKVKALRGQPFVWESYLQNGRMPSDIEALLRSGFETGGPGRSNAEYIIPSALLEEFARIVGIEGANATFTHLEEEIEEWKEDMEDADEEEASEDRELSCGRGAKSVQFVRAPRKRAVSSPQPQS
jgi:hypothetical protein